MRFLLFIATYILHLILRVLSVLYKPFYFLGRYGFTEGMEKWAKHNVHQAVAEDQAANVSLFMVMNKLFTKGASTFHFGDEDDTLSYCLSMNYHKAGKDGPSKNMVKFLRWTDKNHDTKSINNKILRDLEGYRRLKKSGIIDGIELVDVDPDRTDDTWKLYVKYVNNAERDIQI